MQVISRTKHNPTQLTQGTNKLMVSSVSRITDEKKKRYKLELIHNQRSRIMNQSKIKSTLIGGKVINTVLQHYNKATNSMYATYGT